MRAAETKWKGAAAGPGSARASPGPRRDPGWMDVGHPGLATGRTCRVIRETDVEVPRRGGRTAMGQEPRKLFRGDTRRGGNGTERAQPKGRSRKAGCYRCGGAAYSHPLHEPTRLLELAPPLQAPAPPIEASCTRLPALLRPSRRRLHPPMLLHPPPGTETPPL